MKGTTVDAVNSSWIDVLGGLSRWNMRRTPPAFCASAASAQHSNASVMQAMRAPLRRLDAFIVSIGSHNPAPGERRRELLPIPSFPHTRSCRHNKYQVTSSE